MHAGAFTPLRLFSISEYHRMVEAGIIGEDDRVELIGGEVVSMSPIGPRHAACVRRLAALLQNLVGHMAIVAIQDPVRLGENSEPQPDLAILRSRDDFYASAHPGRDDILLLVEVADASVMYDRGTKLPLYAGSGIREVWLIDLVENVLEVHTRPTGGRFEVHTKYGRDSKVRSETVPSIEVHVNDVLP